MPTALSLSLTIPIATSNANAPDSNCVKVQKFETGLRRLRTAGIAMVLVGCTGAGTVTYFTAGGGGAGAVTACVQSARHLTFFLLK